MLILLVSILVVVLLLLMAWSVPRLSLIGKRAEELGSTLTMIDLAAFQSLMNRDDDAFIRASLPDREYRIAKRARTRATQRYLRWIAKHCLLLQVMFAAAIHANTEEPEARRTRWAECAFASAFFPSSSRMRCGCSGCSRR